MHWYIVQVTQKILDLLQEQRKTQLYRKWDLSRTLTTGKRRTSTPAGELRQDSITVMNVTRWVSPSLGFVNNTYKGILNTTEKVTLQTNVGISQED